MSHGKSFRLTVPAVESRAFGDSLCTSFITSHVTSFDRPLYLLNDWLSAVRHASCIFTAEKLTAATAHAIDVRFNEIVDSNVSYKNAVDNTEEVDSDGRQQNGSLFTERKASVPLVQCFLVSWILVFRQHLL